MDSLPSPFHLTPIALFALSLNARTEMLLVFPLCRRATTVPKALPWPCRVPQGSTSQTQAQTAASHVGLDFTVKKP